MVEDQMLVINNEYDINDLTPQQKVEDWDNDGISNEDEYKKGLSMVSDDTDGDGLSDIDEINIYHTDPTKYSTSGDGYSDAYKIVNNMSVNEKHPFSPITLTDNKSVTLIPKEAGDAEKYVYKENSSLPSVFKDDNNKDAEACVDSFTLYSFNGEINYDIENAKEYIVYTIPMFETSIKKIDCKYTDNSISFSNPNNCPVFICSLSSLDSIETKIEYSTATDFYVNTKPLFNILTDIPIIITYDKDTLDIENIEETNKYLSELLKSQLSEGYEEHNFNYPTIKLNPVDSSYIEAIKDKYNKDVFDVSTVDGFIKTLFSFKFTQHCSMNELVADIGGTYSEEESETETEIKETGFNISELQEWDANTNSEFYADSGFNMSKNAFRFSNLSTQVSEGVCAGFSEVTAKIYNDKTIPFNLEKEIYDEIFSYDIRNNAYKSIKNGLLYNYQPQSDDLKTYCDDKAGTNKIDSATLSQPDKEVVKILEFYFKELNEEFIWENVGTSISLNMGIKKDCDFSSIEAIRDKFNSGEIVTVCLTGSGGHAINAYKLEQSSYTSDLFYIRTYDNNFPCNEYVTENGKKAVDGTIYVQRYYENNVFGKEKEKFYFNYSPAEGNDYGWSNTMDEDMCYLWFSDENYNIL